MKKIFNLIRTIFRDAPIVGYRAYLTYRLRSYFGNKAPMLVTVEGQSVHVRPGTPDLRVAFQSLRREFDILSTLLPPDFDGIIVDAGGYIGAAAIKLSKMYPQAVVVSIEPSDVNFLMLEKNIRGHKNIRALKAALHPHGGQDVLLRDRGTGEWGFSIALTGSNSSKNVLGSVSTVSLGDISRMFDNKAIGLLKLDIEGGEYEILKNADSELKQVPLLFVELHDRIVPGCSTVFKSFSEGRWVINAGGEKHLSMIGKPAGLLQNS